MGRVAALTRDFFERPRAGGPGARVFEGVGPRVCVIGAGSSGLPMCKALWDRGVDFTCFEAGDRVGGNWVFRNSNGRSSAYRSLHINTSRQMMEYADWPMPADYPDYPGHELIARYFESYVDAFGFRPRIRFNTEVVRVERTEGGAWRVTTGDGETDEFDQVAVANGHHWDPRGPEPDFEGHFDGPTLHAHHYITPTEPLDLRDRRVCVVGFGNSAVDIACELARRGVARKVFLSTRRGAYVIPHYLFGAPTDHLSDRLAGHLPAGLARWLFGGVHRAVVGRMSDFGLPEPDHRILHAHPTLSSELLPAIGRGDIVPVGNIARLSGDSVEFEGGRREPMDAIIYCTGYNLRFPFFDAALVNPVGNRLPLFRRVVSVEHPGLFFLGLVQPLGAIMPLAEEQAKWLTDLVCGLAVLPPAADMNAEVAEYERGLAGRYVTSPRHTLQVDFRPYLAELRAERRAGAARARSTHG